MVLLLKNKIENLSSTGRCEFYSRVFPEAGREKTFVFSLSNHYFTAFSLRSDGRPGRPRFLAAAFFWRVLFLSLECSDPTQPVFSG